MLTTTFKNVWPTVQVVITAAITFYAWLYGYVGGRRDGYNHALHTFTAPIPQCPNYTDRTPTSAIYKPTPATSTPTPTDNVVPLHRWDRAAKGGYVPSSES